MKKNIGVYILTFQWKKKKIYLYIGASKDIDRRIKETFNNSHNHTNRLLKIFIAGLEKYSQFSIEYEIYPCLQINLSKNEIEFIKKFNPIFNNSLRPYSKNH